MNTSGNRIIFYTTHLPLRSEVNREHEYEVDSLHFSSLAHIGYTGTLYVCRIMSTFGIALALSP